MNAFLIYVLLSLLIAAVFSFRTDRKSLVFILVFFIFAQPILNHQYTIDLPGLFFDLQPNRIMLFVMIPFLLLGNRSGAQRGARPAFEYFLYAYIILVLISLVFNLDRIEAKFVVVIPLQILLYIFIYNVCKRNASPRLYDTIVKAIILLALISVVVAVYQFFVDSTFLKISPPRTAFGNFVRPAGVFYSEYELGFLMNLAIIITLVRKKGFLKYLYLFLFVVTLFLTFHRLNYVILVMCLIAYFFLFGKIRIASVLTVFLVCVSLLYLLINPSGLRHLEKEKNVQDFTQERLLQNTITGRLQQYAVTAEASWRYFMGLGGYENKEYRDLMVKHGLNPDLVVHNGYLATSIKYGFLSMVSFVGFMLAMLIYFKRHFLRSRPETAYPFFIVFIWMLSNLTNSLSVFRILFVLLVSMITGLSVAGNYASSQGRQR